MKRQDSRMICDVGEATEGVGGGGSAHSPTLSLLHLHHSSFSSLANSSVTSCTSQLIIQPFCHFTYITCTSPMSPGELPMSQTPQNQILDTPLGIRVILRPHVRDKVISVCYRVATFQRTLGWTTPTNRSSRQY